SRLTETPWRRAMAVNVSPGCTTTVGSAASAVRLTAGVRAIERAMPPIRAMRWARKGSVLQAVQSGCAPMLGGPCGGSRYAWGTLGVLPYALGRIGVVG